MPPPPDPIVLELAPLPREQVGPFLILGLDKEADKEAVEAHWARRVIWARKGLSRLALEDVNWAREILTDPLKRVRSDGASFNIDTSDRLLARLTERFGAGGSGGEVKVRWQPLDGERDLRNYIPAVEVPSVDEIRAAIVVPDIPLEFPAASQLLDELAALPLDPWTLALPDSP